MTRSREKSLMQALKDAKGRVEIKKTLQRVKSQFGGGPR